MGPAALMIIDWRMRAMRRWRWSIGSALGAALAAGAPGRAALPRAHATSAETPDRARANASWPASWSRAATGRRPSRCSTSSTASVPDDAEVLTLRGIVYRERGLFADAEADLRAALKLAPEIGGGARRAGDPVRRPDAPGRRGGAPGGRPAGAQQPRLPEQPRVLALPARALQGGDRRVREGGAPGAPVAPGADQHGLRLRRDRRSGAAPRASSAWAAARSRPKNNLGFAYERRGDMANAYDLYLQAVRSDPTAARARSNLVHAALVLGRPIPEDLPAPAPAPAPGTAPAHASPPALTKQPVANP